MKSTHLWLAILSLLPLTHAHAYDIYEDAPEFHQEIPAEEAQLEANQADPSDDATNADLYPELKEESVRLIKGKGTWAFKFVFVKNDGSNEVLSEYRADQTMKPASTLKLFTGWMGFSKNAKSAEFLTHMLQVSDNAQANQTLAKVGGTKKLVQFLKSIDLPVTSSNFKPIDGCGLSHSNRATVDLEIDLLEHIYQSEQYHEFKTMLAQPGEDGTLRKRLPELEDRLYGKTGTLRDTAALAGFVELSNGVLIFSVISNQLKISVSTARTLIDDLVEKHATFAEGLPPLKPIQLQPVDMIVNQPLLSRIDNLRIQGQNPPHVESR